MHHLAGIVRTPCPVGNIRGVSLLPVFVTTVTVTGVDDSVATLVVTRVHQFLQTDDDGQHQGQSRDHEGFHRQKTNTAETDSRHHLAHHQTHDQDAAHPTTSFLATAAAAASAATTTGRPCKNSDS
jgi:hypothetical protein